MRRTSRRLAGGFVLLAILFTLSGLAMPAMYENLGVSWWVLAILFGVLAASFGALGRGRRNG